MASVVCVLAAPLFADAQEKSDRVTYVTDRTKNPPATTSRTGAITAETPGKIILTGLNKTPQDIKVADVIEVKYDGEPEELTTARAAERRREFDKALTAYREG